MEKSELKAQYDDITSLYDIADELAETAQDSTVKNPEEHINLLESLISEVAEVSDTLAEEYIHIIQEPVRNKTVKAKVEKALRKMFIALDHYRASMKEVVNETALTVSRLVSPILVKLQKQAEKIMLIFMQLLEISLDRIMRKNELDEFRRNNSHMLGTMQQIAH